uniref:Uncharacterized protein n=1 Tax=Physcomitrium patens TaxID=3218 RepID=A0A2K1KNB1_PHYPA|nr:hypothetical protein PHYPA_006146 [Physcomitrium patens]
MSIDPEREKTNNMLQIGFDLILLGTECKDEFVDVAPEFKGHPTSSAPSDHECTLSMNIEKKKRSCFHQRRMQVSSHQLNSPLGASTSKAPCPFQFGSQRPSTIMRLIKPTHSTTAVFNKDNKFCSNIDIVPYNASLYEVMFGDPISLVSMLQSFKNMSNIYQVSLKDQQEQIHKAFFLQLSNLVYDLLIAKQDDKNYV